MMGFTRKVEYALVALSHLSQQRCADAPPVSARVISGKYNLPHALLMNLMKSLQRAGVIGSTRGANGGYFLADNPRNIMLVDVIHAIEGPIALTPCCTELLPESKPTKKKCEISSDCPLQKPMRRLHDRLMDFMGQITLHDLVDCEVDVTVSEISFGTYDDMIEQNMPLVLTAPDDKE